MSKKEIRIHFLEKRKAIPQGIHKIWSQRIADSVQEGLSSDHKWIHIFLPIASKAEVATHELIKILWASGKKVVVPKIQPKGQLSNHLWMPATPKLVNQWGITEPIDDNSIEAQQLDVVIVPLLAIDQNGQRVGYGKGFYDKFTDNTNCIKIGLSFFSPEELIEDTKSHDLQLDYCITPNQIHQF